MRNFDEEGRSEDDSWRENRTHAIEVRDGLITMLEKRIMTLERYVEDCVRREKEYRDLIEKLRGGGR